MLILIHLSGFYFWQDQENRQSRPIRQKFRQNRRNRYICEFEFRKKPQFGYYFVPMCVTLLLTDYKILYITRLEQGIQLKWIQIFFAEITLDPPLQGSNQTNLFNPPNKNYKGQSALLRESVCREKHSFAENSDVFWTF